MTITANIKRALQLRPKCRQIDPDADNVGYYCRSCGYDLVERGAWFRHGTEWRHPELGR